MWERYWTGWKSMCSQCNSSSHIGHTGEERLGSGRKSSKTSENFHLSTLPLHSGLLLLHAQPEPAKVKDIMSQTDKGSQTIPGGREAALLSSRAQSRFWTQAQGRCRIRKKTFQKTELWEDKLDWTLPLCQIAAETGSDWTCKMRTISITNTWKRKKG